MNDSEAIVAFALQAGIDLHALEEQTTKFPMRFTKAVIIGPRPQKGVTATILNGSATLVHLPIGPVAITCQHVVAEALAPTDEAPRIFQIGDAVIDLQSQLIDQNERLDIATVLIKPEQLASVLCGEEIGVAMFYPAAWPPEPPSEGDFIAFGGFPGDLRTALTFEEAEFGTWSSGASRVDSCSDLQFVSKFEREHWVQSFGHPKGLNLTALGGMSGGPAFILRGLRWDLIGIVKEYHENYDAVFFASLQWVSEDGHISPPVV